VKAEKSEETKNVHAVPVKNTSSAADADFFELYLNSFLKKSIEIFFYTT